MKTQPDADPEPSYRPEQSRSLPWRPEAPAYALRCLISSGQSATTAESFYYKLRGESPTPPSHGLVLDPEPWSARKLRELQYLENCS